MTDLTGKVAYITGGSKGIGLGVAKKLLDAGTKVAISGRSKSSLDAAVELLGSGPNVLALVSDVTKLENEHSAVAQIIQKWGKLDVVLANAGVGHFAPVDELSENDWHQMIDTNLTGVFHTLKASVDALKNSLKSTTIKTRSEVKTILQDENGINGLICNNETVFYDAIISTAHQKTTMKMFDDLDKNKNETT